MKTFTSYILLLLLIAFLPFNLKAFSLFQADQKEVRLFNPVSIYPIPVKEHANIVVNFNSRKMVKVEIFDITGKKIFESKNEYFPSGKNEIKINTREINDGIYFFKVIADKEMITRRIMIRKN